MRETLRSFARLVLKYLARAIIWRYRPGIIGVTGSAGKTSTKMAIKAVLSVERRVRASAGNFNNEIGLPLTILGPWEKVGGLFFWTKAIAYAMHRIIIKDPHYPEILVLEYGIDRPGDMRYLLDIARPNIAVMTTIGEVPVHVEFFSGPEAVAKEKAKLIEYLPTAGFAVLNGDDEIVMGLKNRTRAHVMTFGFGKNTEVHVSNYAVRAENNTPQGIGFKLGYIGNTVPVKINNVFGKTQGYAAAAATAVGLIFGMNLVRISEALSHYRAPYGRMELLRGVKEGTFVIDDSYNASPISMHAALDTIKDLPAKRRIGVLGDMLELGSYAMDAHELLGGVVADALDVLVTVGPRAKFIAEGARKKGFPRKNILSFDLAEEAHVPVQNILKKGDVVLVKGSRAIRLDKVVCEIRAFPEELLKKDSAPIV